MRIGIDARMVLERPTGIGTYTVNLVNNLAQIDSDNEYVLFVNHRVDGFMIAGRKNVKVVTLKPGPFSIMEQLLLPKLIKNENIDVFHSPSFDVLLKVPCAYVVTLHDLTHLHFKNEFSRIVPFYYNSVVRPAVREAKVLITDSENSRKDIIRWLPMCREKIKTIGLGVDAKFNAMQGNGSRMGMVEKLGVHGKFILYNGSKKPHKNVNALIHAFSIIRSKTNSDCTLIIVGKCDKSSRETDDSALYRKVHEMGLNDQVIFTGFVTDDELIDLYRTAEIFVFPSLYEGFGLPPIEAMACGCPVIASNRSSLPEICGDGAYYVNPEDPGEIAEGINAVLNNVSMRKDMVRRGISQAAQFTWQQCARKTLDLYREAKTI